MGEPWQLSDTGPDNYERYQVPSVFGPLADLFLRHIQLQKGQRVLDVACGTGVVARRVAPELGPAGSIVAIDLNANMLEVAASNAPVAEATIEWRQGDATALPCSNGEFDVVLCQQGLQFIPDRNAALREMRRVLKPGGFVGLSVWRGIEHSPCHLAISAALADHVDSALATRFEAPFSFGSYDDLHSLLSGTGFKDIGIAVEEVKRQLLPASESIPGLLASTPVGPELAGLPKATRDAIVEQVAHALGDYREGAGFRVPQSTHIATATRVD